MEGGQLNSKIIIIILMSVLFSSCFKNNVPDSALGVSNTCPTSEDFSGNSGTLTIASNEKVSEKFWINGRVGASVYVSEIIVNMDTSNLSSIKLTLYRDKSVSHVHTPDDGTVLGTTTVTSGLGSSDPNTEISFKLSSDAPLTVGSTYYIILEPTGGSFILPEISPKKVSGAEIMKYNGSYWVNAGSTSSNLSFKMNYSHCTGL